MLKKIYLGAAIFVSIMILNNEISAFCRHCVSERIGKQFEQMNKQIEEMTQEIDKMFSSETLVAAEIKEKPQISLVQEEEQVLVKLATGTGLTQIDASLNDDQLSLDIPEKNQAALISYNKKRNVLSVVIDRSQKEEITKDMQQTSKTFASSTRQAQMLQDSIEFDKAKISYDEGIITISFPKSMKQQPKKIEVEIK